MGNDDEQCAAWSDCIVNCTSLLSCLCFPIGRFTLLITQVTDESHLGLSGYKQVKDYERAVIFRLGKMHYSDSNRVSFLLVFQPQPSTLTESLINY